MSIDFARCTGMGAREQVCPEVFLMNGEGLTEALEPEPHETLCAAVTRAEDARP